MKTIVVNIGNTNIRFGLFNNEECNLSWVINTKPYRTKDELFVQFLMHYQSYNIKPKEIDQLIIGSVVPQMTNDIVRALEKIHQLKPILILML